MDKTISHIAHFAAYIIASIIEYVAFLALYVMALVFMFVAIASLMCLAGLIGQVLINSTGLFSSSFVNDVLVGSAVIFGPSLLIFLLRKHRRNCK